MTGTCTICGLTVYPDRPHIHCGVVPPQQPKEYSFKSCALCDCPELKELVIQQAYNNVRVLVCPNCGVMRLAPDQPNVLQTLETFKKKETSAE